MYDGFVHFDAECAGKSFEAEARGGATVVDDVFPGDGVEPACGDAGLDPPCHLTERVADEVGCGNHLLDLLRSLEIYLVFAQNGCLGRFVSKPVLWCVL